MVISWKQAEAEGNHLGMCQSRETDMVWGVVSRQNCAVLLVAMVQGEALRSKTQKQTPLPFIVVSGSAGLAYTLRHSLVGIRSSSIC